MSYLEPTPESGRRFFASDIQGEVIMLNLLRFREVADYSNAPHAAPSVPITGQQAFDRYISLALPCLQKTGGDLMFLGRSGYFLIGPHDEKWDCVMLVKQKSKEAMLSMTNDADYIASLAHRNAALEDSRLLPIWIDDGHQHLIATVKFTTKA